MGQSLWHQLDHPRSACANVPRVTISDTSTPVAIALSTGKYSSGDYVSGRRSCFETVLMSLR
jgi:hypothetical protein